MRIPARRADRRARQGRRRSDPRAAAARRARRAERRPAARHLHAHSRQRRRRLLVQPRSRNWLRPRPSRRWRANWRCSRSSWAATPTSGCCASSARRSTSRPAARRSRPRWPASATTVKLAIEVGGVVRQPRAPQQAGLRRAPARGRGGHPERPRGAGADARLRREDRPRFAQAGLIAPACPHLVSFSHFPTHPNRLGPHDVQQRTTRRPHEAGAGHAGQPQEGAGRTGAHRGRPASPAPASSRSS
jgi:hypothetical protein